MNDRNKLKKLADYFGDKYTEKPKSILFIDWQKRMIFNDHHEVVKIQHIVTSPKGVIRYENIV